MVLAALVLGACGPLLARAQLPTSHGEATRDELTARAAAAESLAAAPNTSREEQARQRELAQRIRERLTDGDFQPGDRIVLEVEGQPALSDTMVVVGAGQVIALKDIGEISLHGVLRSELQPFLTAQIGQYVKDANVQATGLIRLQVNGQVSRPGFYAMPSDILLGDAIMRAGGPTTTADIEKTTVRRDAQELLSREATQRAITAGKTLDQLSLRAGDEIVVGERTRKWDTFLRVAAVVIPLASVVYGVSRAF